MAPKRKRAAASKAASAKAPKTEAKATASGGKLDFDAFADEKDLIGPEGIERFCNALGLNPSDRKVLILAYLMRAERMGYFTREEFTRGFKAMHCTTVAQLKKALPKLDAAISSPSTFADFYNFAFKFCLTEPGQKIIDKETAAQMIQLAMPEGSRFVGPFSEYLLEQQDYKVVSLDQWVNFLRFSREVAADMSNADDNPAWPVLIDNFVDWYKAKYIS